MLLTAAANASTSTRSSFLHPGPNSSADRLAIVHLKRDSQVPTSLKVVDEDGDGYSEGKVINTRFGSFPHSTLIGLPWGSQVRASRVDTGSRGRREVQSKRTRDASTFATSSKRQKVDAPVPIAKYGPALATIAGLRSPTPALTGFVHLVPPTPENWTSSLPHRTQVVYTPDYSYILHRLRARPGTSIVEAGAGSGSFTHAAARAVYNGYPQETTAGERRYGCVWSYEFHEQRHEKLVEEIQEHALTGIVHLSKRDVCASGFLMENQSPIASAVFLDLPAPWLALPHLSRSPSFTLEGKSLPSPLDPDATVYICAFSPCIEQVQRTVWVMRQLGWVEIETVVVVNKRLEVRRERTGIDQAAQRGVQNTPSDVNEAVTRLLQVEGLFKDFHETGNSSNMSSHKKLAFEKDRVKALKESRAFRKGKLVHRLESDIKTHTSYLVFAILPRDWSALDEERMRQKWSAKSRVADGGRTAQVIGMSRRQRNNICRQGQTSHS